MRISDWISDVCSSDLNPTGSDHVHADLWADRLSTVCANQIASRVRKLFARVAIADSSLDTVCGFRERNQLMMKQDARWIAAFRDLAENRFAIKLWDVGRGGYPIARKSVGEGKGGDVRLDYGGGRI